MYIVIQPTSAGFHLVSTELAHSIGCSVRVRVAHSMVAAWIESHPGERSDSTPIERDPIIQPISSKYPEAGGFAHPWCIPPERHMQTSSSTFMPNGVASAGDSGVYGTVRGTGRLIILWHRSDLQAHPGLQHQHQHRKLVLLEYDISEHPEAPIASTLKSIPSLVLYRPLVSSLCAVKTIRVRVRVLAMCFQSSN